MAEIRVSELGAINSEESYIPYPKRTHILRLLGPKTLLHKAFWVILMVRVYGSTPGQCNHSFVTFVTSTLNPRLSIHGPEP